MTDQANTDQVNGASVKPPPRRRRAVIVVAALVAALAGQALTPTPAQAATSTPVYFVHGLNFSASNPLTAQNCDSWNPMTFKLRQMGWTGPMHEVAYYTSDKNCNTRIASGSNTTSITTFARALSKHIYNTYTSKGKYVNVIAHSMGGLIIRRAIDGAQKKQTGFSPPINVQTVLTLASPHQGTDKAALCSGFNSGCAAMKPFSPFMTYLRDKAWSPQGSDGTYWAVFGSDNDSIVTRVSAVSMGADHKEVYKTFYTHSNIRTDTAETPYLPCDYNFYDGAWIYDPNCSRVIVWAHWVSNSME